MDSHYLIGGKKVGENFRRGKMSLGENLATSENLVTFPRLIFKFVIFPRPIFTIKRTFMSETAFFPEESCSLCLEFFKLSAEEYTVGVTNP